MTRLSRPPDTYPEDIREAFEYCETCEKVVLSVDQHTCATVTASTPGGNGKKSAAERAQLAAQDDRSPAEDVLYPEGRSENNAWAYHELTDGEPFHEVDYDAGHVIGPRGEAIAKGCYPCGTCKLIQERRKAGETNG